MSNVSLSIGGRNFLVACTDGEEAHVQELGQMINAKVEALGGAEGQSESRVLLFVALMLADELRERPMASGAHDDARLVAIADRLENLAASLEAAAGRT